MQSRNYRSEDLNTIDLVNTDKMYLSHTTSMVVCLCVALPSPSDTLDGLQLTPVTPFSRVLQVTEFLSGKHNQFLSHPSTFERSSDLQSATEGKHVVGGACSLVALHGPAGFPPGGRVKPDVQ